jgi:hypothetical protein
LSKSTTVYIYLLNEGVDVWRLVRATQLRDDVYFIDADETVPEDEEWQFRPGASVRCILKIFDDGKTKLVAVGAV